MSRSTNWDVENGLSGSDALKEFEFKSKLSSIFVGVSTNDEVVKNIFRSLYEPVTLFGEGSYERRERLKALILTKYDKLFHGKDMEYIIASSKEAKSFSEILKIFNIDISNIFNKRGNFVETTYATDLADAQEKELFYTEGDEHVKQFRNLVANYSWSRSMKRKTFLHQYRAQCDQYEHKDDIDNFGNHLTQTLNLTYSQLAADRALTMAKFSPNMKYIAASSYCSDLNIFNCTDDRYDLAQKLNSESKEMMHCIDWNYNANHVCYDRIKPDNIRDDNLLLVSGGSGGSAFLWRPFGKVVDDENSGITCMHKFKIHELRVNRILFHPTNNIIVSSSADETIRLYDIERGEEIYTQEGHSHGVYALRINGDGNIMASGDIHGVLLVFDLRTGKHIFQQAIHNGDITSIDFHPLSSHIFATGSSDNSVKIFDLRKLRPIMSLLSHTKLVSEIQFEPIYGRYLATTSFDTSLKIWDSVDYKCRKVLSNDNTRVMGLNIAPDATAIITAGYDRTWRLFKVHENDTINADSVLFKLLH